MITSNSGRRAVAQPVHKLFESHRYLNQLASEFGGSAVNHTAAHERFADCGMGWPFRPVTEEIGDSHGEVLVRVQESCTASNDPVAVYI